MTSDLRIFVSKGLYRLHRPITLTANDSGQNGHTIRWTGDANPVLAGSIQIRGWRRSHAARGLWEAPLPPSVDSFQLFINGKRAIRARVDGCKKPSCSYNEEGLQGAAANLPKLSHPEEVVAVFSVRWRDFHCSIQFVHGNDVIMSQPCWHNTVIDSKKNGWSNASPIGKPFEGIEWFENAFEFLGTPGQFYIDHRKHLVYYTPRLGEDLLTADVEIPTNERLLTIQGTVQRPAHDLSIEGIEFSYSRWIYDRNDGYVPLQAGYLITGHRNNLPDNGEGMWRIPAAIEVSNAERVTFLHDTFSHLGAAGIGFSGATRESKISRSSFSDISGGAIFVGDTVGHPQPPAGRAHHNSITWNTITHVAEEYRDNVAIMGGFNDGLLIAHNTIADLPYTGISVGWGWNYEGTEDTQRNIHIQSNRLSRFMQKLYDGGAIYTQAQSPGSWIAENYIDFANTDHGNGIYLDERSRKFDVCGNVVWNIRKTPSLTDGQWLSAWSSWSGDLDIHDNWSDDPHTKLHNAGKTKLFHDNHLALDKLPGEAERVVTASGADAGSDALITNCVSKSGPNE